MNQADSQKLLTDVAVIKEKVESLDGLKKDVKLNTYFRHSIVGFCTIFIAILGISWGIIKISKAAPEPVIKTRLIK